MEPIVPKRPAPKESPLVLGLRLAWHLGYIIALPAFLFGFGGAYLDKQMGTSPLFILIGFILAILISGFAVVRKVRAILNSSL